MPGNNPVSPAMPARKKAALKRCCLCGRGFHPRSQFDRYCGYCRREEEMFRANVLPPELPGAFSSRFLA